MEACLMHRFFPHLIEEALGVLNRAKLTMPLADLTKLLALNSEDHALEVLEYYGIAVGADGQRTVQFTPKKRLRSDHAADDPLPRCPSV